MQPAARVAETVASHGATESALRRADGFRHTRCITAVVSLPEHARLLCSRVAPHRCHRRPSSDAFSTGALFIRMSHTDPPIQMICSNNDFTSFLMVSAARLLRELAAEGVMTIASRVYHRACMRTEPRPILMLRGRLVWLSGGHLPHSMWPVRSNLDSRRPRRVHPLSCGPMTDLGRRLDQRLLPASCRFIQRRIFP